MGDDMSVCRFDPRDHQTVDGSNLISELSIIRAQRMSSEFALSTAQITYESKMKNLKTEKEILESEKNGLVHENNSLKRKYHLLEFERSCDQSKMNNLRQTLDERINSVLQSSNNLGSSLTLETERLRDEVLNYEKQLTDLQSAHSQLQMKTFKELEKYVEEKSIELKELTEMKSTIFKLTSEKAILEERVLLESNRTKMPEGYDRFIRGASYVAKLELEHDRLKTAFKTLSQERAKWLITEEENSELRNQIDIMKKWRERALISENALLEKETLMNSLLLERENEILLAEQGEIYAKNKELMTILDEKQASEMKLQSRLQTFTSQLDRLKKLRKKGNQIVQLVGKEHSLCQNLLESYILHESDTFNIPSEYLKSMSNLKQLFGEFSENYNDCANSLNNLFKLTENMNNEETNNNDSFNVDLSSSMISMYENDRELIKKLRHQISELEQNIEALEKTNTELLNKLDAYNMRGMCDTEKTKILTYKHRPGEIIKRNLSSEVTELRLLTERQRQRIQVLEERVVY
ncbi:unnamed protein product [Heterobilharzia americana]|nr:unnamed protein product [Heterobilharzia americana]